MKNLVVHNGLHRFSLNDLTHMQQGYQESLSSLSKALINISSPVILEGCTVTKVGNDYTVTQGAIYHDGEIYQVDAHALNTASTPNWVIETTYGVDNPVTYQDGNARNVHQIKKVKLLVEAGIAQWNQIRRVEWVLRNKLTKTGETIMMAIDPSNVDGTGLGLQYTDLEGWALCNGQNGTVDMRKFFPVGFDASDSQYNAIGKTGGANSVTLSGAQSGVKAHGHSISPSTHDHSYVDDGDDLADTGPPSIWNIAYDSGGNVLAVGRTNKTTGGVTLSIGNASEVPATESHENRPPFKVFRFLQKI